MAKRTRHARQRIDNSLLDLVASIRVSNLFTGGSTLSSYGTVAFSNNYSLITLNRIILTYMYTGNGIFQTAVQLPVQDAISKGIEIDSGEMDVSDIDELMEWWESQELWNVILDFRTWVRLFGGGAIIINTNQDPEQPLNMKALQGKPIEFYDVDRWQISNNSSGYNADLFADSWSDQEFYYLYGQKIHKSRVIKGRGKRAPAYVRRQLRGWGMSEAERMIRDINLYLKTQDVLYEILDESKVDIYHIDGLANKLLTVGGTNSIKNRIQAANEIKNYVNALVLDTKETYEQKTMSFAGVAEVMRENRIGIASAVRMPVTKLFGLSASGFNTGESDLENYNSMIESEERLPLRPVIRKILEIGCSYLFGYIPKFDFKYPSLRVLSSVDEEVVKTSKLNRSLALYDRGIIDAQEVAEISRKDDILEIETKAQRGLLAPQPMPPPSGGDDDVTSEEKITLDDPSSRTTRGKEGKAGLN